MLLHSSIICCATNSASLCVPRSMKRQSSMACCRQAIEDCLQQASVLVQHTGSGVLNQEPYAWFNRPESNNALWVVHTMSLEAPPSMCLVFPGSTPISLPPNSHPYTHTKCTPVINVAPSRQLASSAKEKPLHWLSPNTVKNLEPAENPEPNHQTRNRN